MAVKIETVYALDGYYSRGYGLRNIDKTIVIIGAGGTGGYLIPNLARFVSLLNKTRRGQDGIANPDQTNLVIVDGDVVENDNLVRQNFVQQDVGRPKAQVLAERYSKAFGVDISYYDSFMEGPDVLDRLVTAGDGGVRDRPIVVSCVDNNKTRRLIWNWYRKRGGRTITPELFWLDVGNEEHDGQMVISYSGSRLQRNATDVISGMERNLTAKRDDPSTTIYPVPFDMPSYFEMFPNAFQDLGLYPTEEQARERENCTIRALRNPQTIFVNMMAAQVLMNALQLILKHEPLNYHTVFFKTTTNQVHPVKLTASNIRKMMDKFPEFEAELRKLNLWDVAFKGKNPPPPAETQEAAVTA